MLKSSLPVDLVNYTGRLQRGEAFVRAKAALICTDELSVHIKYTRARGRDLNGYYRWEDHRMVLAVKQRLRYPRDAAYGVGTTPRNNQRLGGLPYRLVWHEDRFDSPDDLLVFVAGHEFWHYLCHSGQRKRDHETKANCNGFAWLREFRQWTGPECGVREIPLVPPRPDRVADDAPMFPPAFAERPVPAEPPQSASSVEFGLGARDPSAEPKVAEAIPAQVPLPWATPRNTASRPSRSRSARRPTGATVVETARQLLLFG